MSARPSPSGGPNGQRPTPPPGAPPLRKKPNAANPLVPRKKPARRPPAPTLPKGVAPGAAARPGTKQPHPGLARQGQLNPEALRRQNGGWSTPKPDGAQEFPLYVTKKALKEGLRFHVMRFALPTNRILDQKDPGIDPSNQDDFTRPVTLHRRDPRQPPPGREVKEELPVEEENPVDNAEAERIAQLKADREAQRAADNAQKAPVVKDTGPKTKQKDPKKPGIQVHRAPRTEEQKKQAEIRYEEALPWHLEDADGKNVWVGQYEAPLSDCKIALKIHNGGYRIVPLEKWYKFHSKRGAFNAMTIEEAEKAMNKKVTLGRWAVRDTQRQEAEKAMADSRAIVNGRTAVKQESGTFKSASRREKMDHDDIDMSGDEFQDDDEAATWEPDRDEDTKQANDRIRRDQLNANLFGEADEVKVEKEEDEEKKEELERKKFGKEVTKALKKRDKQFQYSSDSSDGNPFASEVCFPLCYRLLVDTNEYRMSPTPILTVRKKAKRRRPRRTRARAPRLKARARHRARKRLPKQRRRVNLSNGLGLPWSQTLVAPSRPGRRRRLLMVAVPLLLCLAVDVANPASVLPAMARVQLAKCPTELAARRTGLVSSRREREVAERALLQAPGLPVPPRPKAVPIEVLRPLFELDLLVLRPSLELDLLVLLRAQQGITSILPPPRKSSTHYRLFRTALVLALS